MLSSFARLQLSRCQRWIIALLALVLIAGTVTAVSAAQSGGGAAAPVLDGIGTQFRTASHSWLSRLMPVAQRTFTVLATLEFVVSGILWMLRRDSLDDIAGRALTKFILLSFLLTCITSFGAWVPKIVAGFVAAGERATTLTGLSPSTVLDIGWSLSGTLLEAISLKNAVLNPITSGFVVLLAFGMWLAFVGIAAQLLRVLVESYIVLTGGILFLGFAGFRATAGYAENYLNYAVNVGIKIFLVYLIVSVGMEIVPYWAALLKAENWNVGSGNSSVMGQVFGGAVLFALLALTIPGHAAARITGHHSLGIANALRGL